MNARPDRTNRETRLRELPVFQHDGIRGCVDGVTPPKAWVVELTYGTMYVRGMRGSHNDVDVVVAGPGGGFCRRDRPSRAELTRFLERVGVDGSTPSTFGPADEIVPSRFRGEGGGR